MKKNNLLAISFLLLISGLMLRSFFRQGIFTAHDIENHLARIANYASALKTGQIPVRWAGNLNHKFGYPVFNYNYPLPNILGLPLMSIGFDIQTTLKIILFLAYWLSGVFFYLWVKRHVTCLSALLGAIFYLTFPYQLIDIYIRGVVGENLTIALFPAVLLFIDNLIHRQSRLNYLILTITVWLFSLSHNVYVLLFTPLTLIYLAYRSKTLRNIKRAWIAVANGFLISSFFWIPAWFEKKYINLVAFDPTAFYRDHFVVISQLINDRWRFGYSGSLDQPMTLTLGWPLILVLVVSVIMLCVRLSGIKIGNHKSFFINQLTLTVGIVFLILMITPASQSVWKVVPFIGYLQFPWRLLGLIGFFSACLVSIATVHWPDWVKGLLILGLIIYTWRFTYPFGWEQKDDNYFFEYPFTTTTRHENTPIWFSEDNIININSDVKIMGEKTNPANQILTWKPNMHRYEIENDQSQMIWERTAYFPGWKLWIDGQQSAINYNNQKYPGLIGYNLTVGKHQIQTKFTEDTPARIAGDTLSIMGLAGLGLLLLKGKFT